MKYFKQYKGTSYFEGGLIEEISEADALHMLQGNYKDPAYALMYATKENPAQTPHAYYWQED